ncbi:MAG: hypothetical protein PVI86_07400 [Phycisphaerae bacterium]
MKRVCTSQGTEDAADNPATWPFVHFFVPFHELDEKERNGLLAEAFCCAHQQQVGGATRVLGVELPNKIDAIVEIEGREIVLEFAGYYRRDEFHDVERADSTVRAGLSKALTNAGLGRFQIRIWWREEPRRKRCAGQRPTVGKVPRRRGDGDAFVGEFVRLASRVAEEPGLASRRILFRQDTRTPRSMPENLVVLPASEFPVLADRLEWVVLEPWKHEFNPEIKTNVDVRRIGLDEGQLRRVVCNKLTKLRKHYRDRAWGKPVWLLVHCDGHPSPSRIALPQRPDAMRLISELLHESDVSFDAVWWGENMMDANMAELFRVI